MASWPSANLAVATPGDVVMCGDGMTFARPYMVSLHCSSKAVK